MQVGQGCTGDGSAVVLRTYVGCAALAPVEGLSAVQMYVAALREAYQAALEAEGDAQVGAADDTLHTHACHSTARTWP